MHDYQRAFVELSLEQQALRFGEFTLKSGRRSPYFFNAGCFDGGRALRRLGHAYARSIRQAAIPFDMLFGPAYKGIPLAAAIAIAFDELFDRDVPYAFDRKEAKDHGEGGVLVGAPLVGRVLVVDDVISAGTSAREAAALIQGAGAVVAGLAIALDRRERGRGERSAVQEVEDETGAPVVSIVDLDDLITYLDSVGLPESDDRPSIRERMVRYRRTYGVVDLGEDEG